MSDILNIKDFRKLVKKPMQKKEEDLQMKVCKWLDNFPSIVYTSDLSGIKLTIGSAVKAKKQRSKIYKIPDLLILQPNKKYCGLIIELKKDKSEVFGKKNQLLQNQHTQSQIKTLLRLHELGYCATFGFGYHSTIDIIEKYINDEQPYIIIDKM